MTTVRRNVIANYGGSIGSAILSVILVPVYIHHVGVESYALIGVFAILQSIFTPLDAGLSQTLARSLAVLSAREQSGEEMRNLVRTLETVYWAAAGAIGCVLVALAPLISGYWLKPQQLTAATVTHAVSLMGLITVAQWPLSLYMGGLSGLQRQVTVNSISLASHLIGGIGAILVLRFVSSTISAFLIWQGVVYAGQTAAMAWALYRALPSGRGGFRGDLLATSWRTASGLSVISVVALVLTQTDKIVLSRMLDLRTFGFYTIAATAAANLYRVAGPLAQAVFPRFAEIVGRHDEAALRAIYHRSCQWMSVAVIPVAVMVSVFSYEALLLWTRKPIVAAASSTVLALLMIGTMLHALVILPYQLQVAYGWLRLTLNMSIPLAFLFPPAVWLLTLRFGPAGAAVSWIFVNAVQVFITVRLMHRRLLRGDARTWYLHDVGRPLLAVVAIATVARLVIPPGLSPGPLAFALAAAGALAILAATAASPLTHVAFRRAYAARPNGIS